MKKIVSVFVSCLILFVGLFVTVAPTFAHDFSLTYSSVSITDKTVNVAVTTPYANIVGIYPEKDTDINDIDLKFFNKPFMDGFIVKNNGDPCKPHLTNVQKIPESKLVAYQYEFICKDKFDKLTFSYKLFFDVSQSHENIVDFYVDDYNTQQIFSQKKTSFDLPVGDLRNKLGTYNFLWNGYKFFTLGIEHIFTGYDHILFLLGLVVVTVSLPSLLKIVSSFTVAHSITLILAALGVFILPARLTESLIALSIVYVALENLSINKKNRFFNFFANPSKRWMIVFLFGLIHGFGFSSVLRDIGLPKDHLISTLLLFNIGIEVGQVIIVLLVFPALWLSRKKWQNKVVSIVSIIIGIMGLIWFIQRAFLFQ